MPEPELAGDAEEGGDDPFQFGGEDEEDFEVGTVDLGLDDDDDIIAGFDGVEDEKSGDGGGDGSSGGKSGGQSGDVAISDAIENGLAETAAIGLTGSERNRVRKEMKAVASQFKVGYFGERCVQKYMNTDLDNIPPEYGLAAALIAFFAIALYKRPDGEERVRHAVSIVRDRMNSRGGAEDFEEEHAEPESEPEPESPVEAEGSPEEVEADA